MRPMRCAGGLPHVGGGGSEGGPPPSVFPRPLSDMFSTEKSSTRKLALSDVSTATATLEICTCTYTNGAIS